MSDFDNIELNTNIDLDALQPGWCQSPELPVNSNWELVQQVLKQRENPIPPSDPRYSSAAFYRNSTWTPGQTIKVGFLDGTQQQQDATKAIVMKYLAPIVGLNFEWVPSAQARSADIRVTYNYSGGGLSCVGRGSKTCDIGGGSSLKLAPNVANSTYIVLHEFGHAMGLSHEHQTTCNNPLDVTGLGQWYQRNTEVDPNMCSPWDKDSVMNYFFTSKNGISVKPMQVYSPVDIEWLSKIYPPKKVGTGSGTGTGSTPGKTQGSTPGKTPTKKARGPLEPQVYQYDDISPDEFPKEEESPDSPNGTILLLLTITVILICIWLIRK
jgi:hypothetical protein